jgi:hypothetical protein
MEKRKEAGPTVVGGMRIGNFVPLRLERQGLLPLA